MPFSKRQLFILAGVIGVIILLIAAIMLGGQEDRMAGRVNITVWGVMDPVEAYQEIFNNLEAATGISVTYLQKDIANYETEWINALAVGRGPDVLMIHNTWLGKHSDKLVPAPIEIINPAMVRDLYPTVVTNDFVAGGQVWALPLSVDTLALFYNRHLFDQAGIALPPGTWEDVLAIVPRLARTRVGGEIDQPAIALGTAFNVSNAADILSMLMMQLNSPIVRREEARAVFGDATGRRALEFYVQFANPAARVYAWNSEQPDSISMFADGNLAMMLAYASQISEVRAIGPFVDFDIASLPQWRDRRDRVDYASYWGFAVSRQSRNSYAAWRFIHFLTSEESARIYLRNTGRPPALRALIRENINQPVIGIFSRQALTAQSWFQPDPARAREIFLAMIESVRRRELDVDRAVRRAVDQINLLLARFRE